MLDFSDCEASIWYGNSATNFKRPSGSALQASRAKRRRTTQSATEARAFSPADESDDDESTRSTAQQGRTAGGLPRIPSFPCKAPNSARKVAQVLKVLAEMYSALLSDTIVTKRDIYYRCPALFGAQVVVDRIVDMLSAQMGASRWAMGVTAASKGLVVGAAELLLDPCVAQSVTEAEHAERAGKRLEVNHTHETLIPASEAIWDVSSDAKWVLVVEKEAVFRTLREACITKGCWAQSLHFGEGLMVTGKGYPDLITREFLARICTDESR